MRTGANDDVPRVPQTERTALAGMFELFNDAESDFRFRLTAPDGTVMAVSKPFTTKKDAVAGIAAVREYAGMGLITDSCTAAHPTEPRTSDDPASQSTDPLKASKIDSHARARAVRRAVSGPRWAGAIHSLF